MTSVAFCRANPVVETSLGTVSGESITLTSGDVIDSFIGIPFAAPPISELRFEVRFQSLKKHIYRNAYRTHHC